ncbi:MAG TPA: hypothetical protein VF745_13225 [Steroidobacteraceae bacterium]
MSTPQSSAGGPHTGSDRPWFLAPEVERVLAVTMAIAQELAVARVRIDTLERLLERKGVLARPELETFEPNAADSAERGQWNREYVARVLRVLQPEQTST